MANAVINIAGYKINIDGNWWCSVIEYNDCDESGGPLFFMQICLC